MSKVKKKVIDANLDSGMQIELHIIMRGSDFIILHSTSTETTGTIHPFGSTVYFKKHYAGRSCYDDRHRLWQYELLGVVNAQKATPTPFEPGHAKVCGHATVSDHAKARD